MKGRDFLKAAGAGMATSAVAAPAVAQSMPEIRWRLTASWPKSLDILYGSCETLSKYVAEATDNKFQVPTLRHTLKLRLDHSSALELGAGVSQRVFEVLIKRDEVFCFIT